MSIEDQLSESQRKFRQKLLISESNLAKGLQRQAANIYTLYLMVAEAEDNYDRVKRALEFTEKTLRRSRRRKAAMEREKISESQLDDDVKLHPEYEESYNNYLDAKKLLKQVKGKYTSMQVKGEMLTNYGHMIRKEIDAGKSERMKITKE